VELICPTVQAKYFPHQGWTGSLAESRFCLSGKSPALTNLWSKRRAGERAICKALTANA
jgi:hypothetical protein